METARTITDLESLASFAKEVLENISSSESEATVVALHGDLGAGKTALVQQFGNVLGIQEPITSPTFTIMKQYDVTDAVFDSLVHIDAYRLESEIELGPLKIVELFKQPNTLICIEWAERLGSTLPQNTVHIALSINDDHSRTANITLGQA